MKKVIIKIGIILAIIVILLVVYWILPWPKPKITLSLERNNYKVGDTISFSYTLTHDGFIKKVTVMPSCNSNIIGPDDVIEIEIYKESETKNLLGDKNSRETMNYPFLKSYFGACFGQLAFLSNFNVTYNKNFLITEKVEPGRYTIKAIFPIYRNIWYPFNSKQIYATKTIIIEK